MRASRLLRLSAASAPLALLLIAPVAHAQQTNPFGLTSTTGANRPALADLDGDGDLDVLSCAGNAFAFYLNTGTPTVPAFAAPQATPFGLPGCSGPIALGDLNGDGDLDLFAGTSAGLTYFENTGTAAAPAFGAAQINPFGLAAFDLNPAPALADFDGDGDLDLIAGGKNAGFSYFTNTGTATAPAFGAAQTNPFGLTSGASYSQPAVGDYDGDGLVDVLAGFDSGTLSFYRNTGTAAAPAFGAPQTPAKGTSSAGIGSRPAPTYGNLNGSTVDVLVGLNNGDFAFFNDPSLPVELVGFTAALDGEVAVLRWETASETGNAGFAVERLTSDGLFADGAEHLGFVAGQGTTSEAHRYTFRTERLGVGAHRFRLRQIDTDGTATLSPTVEVRVGTEGAFALTDAAPSPTRGASRLTLSVARAQAVTVAVYDALGRRVTTLHDGPMGDGEARTFEIDTRAWASGAYHVVATGERFRADRRLVVVR